MTYDYLYDDYKKKHELPQLEFQVGLLPFESPPRFSTPPGRIFKKSKSKNHPRGLARSLVKCQLDTCTTDRVVLTQRKNELFYDIEMSHTDPLLFPSTLFQDVGKHLQHGLFIRVVFDKMYQMYLTGGKAHSHAADMRIGLRGKQRERTLSRCDRG